VSAYEELVRKAKETETIRRVLADLEKEPARLLFEICREYEACLEPVPDHRIHLPGYLGEISLKALLAAGLLDIETGRRLSIYQYKPTTEGLEWYRRLVQEGWEPARKQAGAVQS
jgi:hypothetical protein